MVQTFTPSFLKKCLQHPSTVCFPGPVFGARIFTKVCSPLKAEVALQVSASGVGIALADNNVCIYIEIGRPTGKKEEEERRRESRGKNANQFH